jgi:hypothetical protein
MGAGSLARVGLGSYWRRSDLREFSETFHAKVAIGDRVEGTAVFQTDRDQKLCDHRGAVPMRSKETMKKFSKTLVCAFATSGALILSTMAQGAAGGGTGTGAGGAGATSPGSAAPGGRVPVPGNPGPNVPGTTIPGHRDPGTTTPGTDRPAVGTPGQNQPGSTTPGNTLPGRVNPGSATPAPTTPRAGVPNPR